MLVVIVISAATLFAAFLATYEKQVLSEEANQHLISLEKVRVDHISEQYEGGCDGGGNFLNVTIVSGDVNFMNLTGYVVDGNQALGWCFIQNVSTPHPPPQLFCDSTPACTELAPYAEAYAWLPAASLSESSPVHLVIETSFGNDFSFLFFPPVAIIETTILPVGGASEPLFDGAQSYDPSGGDNASIASYSWTIVECTTATCSAYVAMSSFGLSGPEIEPYQLSSSTAAGDTFQVNLTVTNTDGLLGTASVIYQS